METPYENDLTVNNRISQEYETDQLQKVFKSKIHVSLYWFEKLTVIILLGIKIGKSYEKVRKNRG